MCGAHQEGKTLHALLGTRPLKGNLTLLAEVTARLATPAEALEGRAPNHMVEASKQQSKLD